MKNYFLHQSKTFKYLKVMRLKFQKIISKIAMPEYTMFSIFAIIIGTVVGLAAVLFHKTIDVFTWLFFEFGTEAFFFLGAGAVIVIPAIGMIIQSLMIHFFPKTAKRRGVSEVIKSVAIRGGYIPFRTTLFHFFAPAICLGSGGTLGPEGPAAQLGGGMASKMGQLLGLSDSRRRMFTAAGAGAAISAVFNTPLGGIFFALEIILLNDFQSVTFSALILASVTASAISRIFLGNSPAFQFETTSVGPYEQYYLFIILGIIAGLISLAFIRYSSAVEHLIKRKMLAKIPRWRAMAIVGIIVGVAGFFYSDIFGIGYSAINKVLASSITWQIAVILLVLKFILVPLILYSGGFGGVFAPSLFMGACFGYIYALGLNYFWGLNVDTTTYVLVSMGAVLGGINSIPIAAILIIFEMTKDYTFILPLMLAVVISTTMVQIFLKGSIHIKHLEEEGFHIISGRESSILQSIQVKDAIREDVMLIPQNTPLFKLVGQLVESPHNTIFITDTENKIVGTISENELRPIITEYDTLREMIVASDIASPEVITVNEEDDLDYVLKLFGSTNLDELPVITEEPEYAVIGSVWRQDVISAYNKESLKYNITDGLASELKALRHTTVSKIADGYSIIEKNAPQHFIGKTLTQLKIRNHYHLEVLMIKQKRELLSESTSDNIIMPDPKYKIQQEDKLVLFGADEKIEEIKNW
ncbi:MAG: chloride channel protein [Bacteroidota bacterium]